MPFSLFMLRRTTVLSVQNTEGSSWQSKSSSLHKISLRRIETVAAHNSNLGVVNVF